VWCKQGTCTVTTSKPEPCGKQRSTRNIQIKWLQLNKRFKILKENYGIGYSIDNYTGASIRNYMFFYHGVTAPSGPRTPDVRGFTFTRRHTTLGRTPLDEQSFRRLDLYMTTHNTHNRQTSMPPTGFEPKNPACERPQPHALKCAATQIGIYMLSCLIYI